MKKLTATQLARYIDMYKKYYYKVTRGYTIINNKKYYYSLYFLENNVEKNSLFYDLIYQYPNTRIGYSQTQYAPEIKHTVIFLYDQKLSNIEKRNKNEKTK